MHELHFFLYVAFKRSYHAENTFNKFNLKIVYVLLFVAILKCYLMLLLELLMPQISPTQKFGTLKGNISFVFRLGT